MAVSAVATAVFHILVPDHWLPFVLIGRARHWGIRRTATVSGVSALIHVALSIVLGIVTLAVGRQITEWIGHGLERASGVLLIAFGAGYALWAWRKGGHFHPGGARLHRDVASEACDGEEGPGDATHLHYHADDAWIRGEGGKSEWVLAGIVGLNPCILLLPLLLAVAEHGALAVTAVTLAYALPTVFLMVGLSVVGVAAARMLPVPGIARYMEALSGVLIALTGVAFFLLDH
jgi:ABC-type nickel/cobalt efflux system permease component RcnA